MRVVWLGVTILFLLLAGCLGPSPRPAPTATVLVPFPSQTLPHPATPASTAPVQPTAPATPSPSASPVPLTEPTVLDRYPLDSNQQGEVLAASPERVWVGTTFGSLEEHDAARGRLISTTVLAPGSADAAAPVKALAFDGQLLWALVSSVTPENEQITQLFVLDPASKKVLQQVDLSESDPLHIGQAPGQVWLQNQVYDTATRSATAVEMTTDATVFAYDGAGWMWTGGGASICDTCPTSIYRFKTGSLVSEPGPAASQSIKGMALAGQRMWVATDFNRLDGYDPADPELGAGTQPKISLDLSLEMENPPTALLSDGHSLWLLASVGLGGGFLYQHDPQTGQMLASLPVGDPPGAENPTRVPVDAVFDGRDLWVLTTSDLVRVGLPWTR